MKFRTLAVLVLLGGAGGVGVWQTQPELVGAAAERWRAAGTEWRATGTGWIDSIRHRGQALLARIEDVVGLSHSTLHLPSLPSTRQVVWATAGGELLRTEMPASVHDEFVAALRAAQSQDRDRLAHLAEQRLRQDAESQIADTTARIPAFLDEIAGMQGQFAAISGGFSALGTADGDTAASLSEKAAALLGERYVELYRQRVLRPELSLPALRAIAGRVAASVLGDLIRSCDRYDQAFRSFLVANATKVEVFNQDGRWVGAEWKPAEATFRSLCQTLRAARTDEATFDEAVMRTIGDPAMAVHDIAREIAGPASDVVGGMSASYQKAFSVLSGYGLPQPVAKVPAVLWSYGVCSPALVSHLLRGPVQAPDFRKRIEAALTDATRAGMLEVLRGLDGNLMTFVDGELGGIASGVSARVERPRNEP